MKLYRSKNINLNFLNKMFKDKIILEEGFDKDIGKHSYSYDVVSKQIRINDLEAYIDIHENGWSNPYLECRCADLKVLYKGR